MNKCMHAKNLTMYSIDIVTISKHMILEKIPSPMHLEQKKKINHIACKKVLNQQQSLKYA